LDHFLEKKLTHWPNNVKYVLFVDESGNKDMQKLDPNWPILSIFGVLLELEAFLELQKLTNKLKSALWPPEGNYLSKGKKIKVCFHSREMRRKEGPFSERTLKKEQRQFMDDFLWDKTLKRLDWKGICCILDKRRLLKSNVSGDPYTFAVTFLLESLVVNVDSPAAVIFEARGKAEDRLLWEFIKQLINEGTAFLGSQEIQSKIAKVGGHPKFNDEGKVVCGLEIADLCAYSLGAKYLRGSNAYAEKIWPKLLGYEPDSPGAVYGKGYKILP
jgi:hypothetical protein